MSKLKQTQIDKSDRRYSDGSIALENVYNLYEGGVMVRQDVPFEMLAAAPEMVDFLKRIGMFALIGRPLNWSALLGEKGQTIGEELQALIAKATSGAE